MADTGHDARRVNIGVVDVALNLLLLIGEKAVHIARAPDVVLADKAVQRGAHLLAHRDFVGAQVVGHQDNDIVKVGGNVVHIADEVEQLQHCNILRLYAHFVLSSLGAAVNNAGDGAVQERVQRVVEQIERCEGVLVLGLDLLRGLLEAGQHRAFAARKVLARVAVLADLGKDLLHDDELIRHEGEVIRELLRSAVALDVEDGVGEAEQIAQHSVVFVVECRELGGGIRRLFQDTLLDDLIHRGRRQRKPRFEPRLNAGELVRTHANDLVDGLLPSADDPNMPAALAANFLHQRLQVEQQVCVRADILADFVHHEQQAKVFWLCIEIFFDFGHKPRDAHIHILAAVEPVAGGGFAHTEGRDQRCHDVVLKEYKCVTGIEPFRAGAFGEAAAEVVGLAALGDELLELGDLQILAVKAEVVVEHLCKDAQHSCFVFVNGTFRVDVEQDRFGFAAGRSVDVHKGGRVVRKFGAEPLHRAGAVDFAVFQQVGKHFQKVRFTAAEEAGNPDADVVGRRLERLTVIVKEGRKVAAQLAGDHVLVDFLQNDMRVVLINADNTADVAVDVIGKHIAYHHSFSPYSILNAR